MNLARDPRQEAALDARAAAIVEHPERFSPEEVEAARERLGLGVDPPPEEES